MFYENDWIYRYTRNDKVFSSSGKVGWLAAALLPHISHQKITNHL